MMGPPPATQPKTQLLCEVVKTVTWLLVKRPKYLSAAEAAFANSGTTHGVKHLGAPLGDRSYAQEYERVITGNAMGKAAQVALLSWIVKSQPHLGYCALTQGMIGKWRYMLRTVSNASEQNFSHWRTS